MLKEPTLYLIRGVPGSGKSSLGFALLRAGLVGYSFEADDYFLDSRGNYNFDPSKLKQAHEYCQNQVKQVLHHRVNVAVTNTSTTEKEVQVYEEIAKEYGAKFVSLIVENRHGGTSIHAVPEEKVQQMKNRFSIKL